ncbi:MAG: CocE/NonD family hydrolase [Burkholderiales bacterium]|nr:CocE/NonD family hydrolase [Burkholderiales bacterium]
MRVAGKGTQHSTAKTDRTYDPPRRFERMTQQLDVMVPMRDGVRICVDVFRPEAQGKFPALLAFAPHNKDLQAPALADFLPPQPAWSGLWQGGAEAGDSRYITSRGYAHVIGNPRSVGKSEDGGSPDWDLYDLIEWIAREPWCDGNVGMVGLSAYAASQWAAAMLQPPHLKAIFPFDANAAYGYDDRPPFTFKRDLYPGGVLHVFTYLLAGLGVFHGTVGRPGELPREEEAWWREAMENPDFKIYSHMYNILTMKGELFASHRRMFNTLVNPYDDEAGESVRRTEEAFGKIRVPAYTGAGWHALTYKQHLLGAQHWFMGIGSPKKLILSGPAHMERPFHSFHDEILRWYDHWLKGIDTGIMDEPPVKVWVMGANRWHYGSDWPLPQTQWTKYYLHSWERLRAEPFAPGSREAYDAPDAFVQMPPTQTRTVQKLRYLTDPLPEDTLVIGPLSLTLYASIDQDDTNWIVILKDVGPDPTVRTARDGERDLSANLPERELTRGWLKASMRALDPKRSRPWKPFHRLTRSSRRPVVPGEINEYVIEIMSTANLFEKGHRICLEITCLDMPSGAGLETTVEYIPYHICSSKTVLHKIYHNDRYPSHLLLPLIPAGKG